MVVLADLCVMFTVAGWGLWHRRRTWGCRGETALTAAVALATAGAFLSAPAQTGVIGAMLYDATGLPHLDDYIGQLCCLGAACMMIRSATSRLTGVSAIEWRNRATVVVAAVVMGIGLIRSDNLIRHPHHHILTVPCDGWLTVYWMTYATALTIMICHYLWLLDELRRLDPRARTTPFVAAAMCGLLVAGSLMLRSVLPSMTDDCLIWTLAAVSGMIVAVAAARSWQRRLRPFQRLMNALDASIANDR